MVSSPDSPTSEESSPSPSPETEDAKKPLVKSTAAVSVGLTLQQRIATLRKPTGSQQKSLPSTSRNSGILGEANGLLPSAATELAPIGTGDDLQQQIQTPTSSTTTEDSRKEATAREADGEASDEEKEEDGDDDEDEEERRTMGMEDDVQTTSNDEEEE